MPRGFNLKGYINLINANLVPFTFTCRSCGSSSYVLSQQRETFCNFCEGHVNLEGMNAVHANAQIEKNLTSMISAAKSGQWADGIQYADALAATKDPFFLYGASHFYKFFSDFTYYDVNYNLGGFMYSNADKRSDELLKNKYNAMALISKSKEYLFKSLKMLSMIPPDSRLTYLKFMCNIKLRRYGHAASALVDLSGFKDAQILSKYASMVFDINSGVKIPQNLRVPDITAASGSANIFYYVAKHMSKSGDLDSAITLLESLNKKVYMPLSLSYTRRIIDVKNALDY